MIKEQLITFETAKLADEKGFSAIDYLSYSEISLGFASNYNPKEHQVWYINLSQSLLQKWLREVHKIHLVCWWYDRDNKFYTELGRKDSATIRVQTGDTTKLFDTYEEALEVGLLEALKLIQIK